MYSNLNILNRYECKKLLAILEKKHQDRAFINWNQDLEMCAGKKQEFPLAAFSFLRQSKKSAEFEKELMKTKESKFLVFSLTKLLIYCFSVGLPEKIKPTKYKYKALKAVKKKRRVLSLGMPEDYPFDWYLGGSDSCQVNSRNSFVII